jgi:hypothetical protein
VTRTAGSPAPSLRLPALGAPPLGFEERRGARGVVWLRADLADALAAAGLRPDATLELAEAEVGGRVPLRAVEVAGRAVLVREFTHGGLAGRALGAVPRLGLARTFRDARRPFVELALAERLAAVGVPVPEVVCARATRGPCGWRLSLATLRIGVPGPHPTRDLGEWIGQKRLGSVAPRAAERLARAAGRLVARLHEVGFLHADLQPANLLVVGDPNTELPRVVALDLDRSRFLPGLDTAARHRNLARLWRHVRRREELYGAAVSRTDRARFLRAWARETRRGAKPAAARELWRAAWRAIEGLERRGRGMHRLGWSVGRLFGGSADTRAAHGSARRRD